MNEVWVVESITSNLRPSAFDGVPEWHIAKVCKSKRLADAWREDREEGGSFDSRTGYETKHRTVRYVKED
jgi:hypothetical protein